MNPVYYHLYPGSLNPCSMAKTASELARETWLCVGCASPRPETTVIDVSLQDIEPTGVLNFVIGHGVPLIRRDFLLSFGKDMVDRDLYIGRVFGRNGKELTDWATFRARQQVIIRGAKNVSYRKCAQCGRTVYFAMGHRYLCPLPAKVGALSESDLFGLVISEYLFTEALQGCTKWAGVQCDRLPVLETPKDNLPIHL
jgi:hypothetical protein